MELVHPSRQLGDCILAPAKGKRPLVNSSIIPKRSKAGEIFSLLFETVLPPRLSISNQTGREQDFRPTGSSGSSCKGSVSSRWHLLTQVRIVQNVSDLTSKVRLF